MGKGQTTGKVGGDEYCKKSLFPKGDRREASTNRAGEGKPFFGTRQRKGGSRSETLSPNPEKKGPFLRKKRERKDRSFFAV